jgi:hypothetical protein
MSATPKMSDDLCYVDVVTGGSTDHLHACPGSDQDEQRIWVKQIAQLVSYG